MEVRDGAFASQQARDVGGVSRVATQKAIFAANGEIADPSSGDDRNLASNDAPCAGFQQGQVLAGGLNRVLQRAGVEPAVGVDDGRRSARRWSVPSTPSGPASALFAAASKSTQHLLPGILLIMSIAAPSRARIASVLISMRMADHLDLALLRATTATKHAI